MNKKIKVKILRGCSGSGKTTLRKEWLSKQHYGVISRDELRNALFGQYGNTFNNAQEDIISDISYELLQRYIKRGMDVIIDNTNLKAKDVRPYLEIIEFYKDNLDNDINIEFVDLTDIPLKKLKKQNTNRATAIPESEVERQFKISQTNNNFYKDIYSEREKFINDTNKQKAVIFDLDGTLAIKSKNRSFYDTEGFIDDKLNEYVYQNYLLHKNAGHKIIICTARDECCRMETWEWLKKHKIQFDEIFFRKDQDRRKDYVVKKEMWAKILKKYYIACLYDDRVSVVKAARKMGLNVYSVNHMYY